MPVKLVISKKVVSDFGLGENIHCDREISPPHTYLLPTRLLPTRKLRHFFTHNISENRHMTYDIHFC